MIIKRVFRCTNLIETIIDYLKDNTNTNSVVMKIYHILNHGGNIKIKLVIL
jgi:hypothetical protein